MLACGQSDDASVMNKSLLIGGVTDGYGPQQQKQHTIMLQPDSMATSLLVTRS